MKKLLLILLIACFVLVGCNKNEEKQSNPSETNIGKLTFEYYLDYADGECDSISDCNKIEYGCGKIVCTGDPEQYKDMNTDCSIEENHPASQGYKCGCVPNEYKCGWIK
ncbi:MAG: hypothetical protein ABIG10_03015 [bacterium]